ncbi:sigma-54-dependent Fis family transcriptional regulator [Candidatus Pantoea floridensis]|uniref:ABC transporter, substrate-binding protein, aliphatic sulfonates family n=1 Tax=Candidatus Pantoea floridensis TaxID=1938870 RepID=A0A286DPW7_9GAMM|nr:sigma-54-dependent Fis family transcriptional regulator [Pantoea floridensis]PIF14999.1 aliphatic sulfonates family ABC transporter substrate-binding protein [Enterobacteriaceae bacterium JKS000233]SOD60690.1 ABC transporter, substrate-binding protein, aliphatic sulfonates family [Pantoea floridensis]
MLTTYANHTDSPRLVDPASLAFQSLLDKFAPTDATVLIVGETGTGKEVVARYLHHHSQRRHGPFLAVNCGALTESLAEAELFGHEKGAFTGATQAHPGWFESAQGGTLLLDEIGELSPSLQVKLLRVLQEREITRVGSRKSVKVDVRVIAATHVDLAQAIRERRFREDLFYRLNIAVVPLPPLRQRREDIPLLAQHFLALYSRRLGRPARHLSPDALEALLEYSWPGNIRELENTLHNAVLLSREETLTPAQLRIAGYSERGLHELSDSTLDSFLQQQLISQPQQLFDRVINSLISNALEMTDQNQTQAAALLGISRHTLRTHLANQGMIKGRRKAALSPPNAFIQGKEERELRIGYQKFGNLGVLKARQSLEHVFAEQGISVLWSEFPAGPQLLYALQNNEIDFGTTGEVPPIFAQANGSGVTYIAWEPPAPSSVGIVVPRGSDIRTVEDLRGKRISVNKGSNVHWLLLQLLEEAGIGLEELKVVYTPPKYPLTASDYVSVDAWMMWDPLLSAAESNPELRILVNGEGQVNNHQFYLARRDYVEKHDDILRQLVESLQQTGSFIDSHRHEASAMLAQELGLEMAAVERALTRRSHKTRAMAFEVIKEQQIIADRFYALGLINKPVRVRDAIWQFSSALALIE